VVVGHTRKDCTRGRVKNSKREKRDGVGKCDRFSKKGHMGGHITPSRWRDGASCPRIEQEGKRTEKRGKRTTDVIKAVNGKTQPRSEGRGMETKKRTKSHGTLRTTFRSKGKERKEGEGTGGEKFFWFIC